MKTLTDLFIFFSLERISLPFERIGQRVEPPFRMLGESLLIEVYAVMPVFLA
jgi:hypothetical protein